MRNLVSRLQLACGSAHTLALTRVFDSVEGEGELKTVIPRGGTVYMAGLRSVLGMDCPVFTLADAIKDQPCVMVSTGCAHVCVHVCVNVNVKVCMCAPAVISLW